MLKILVGNLEQGATEESVRYAFATYGAVVNVSLPRDKRTRLSRGGFAVVEMSESGGADRAIAMLNGRQFGLEYTHRWFLVPI